MNRRVNGVDTLSLFATADAVRAQPELAEFRFRARTEWVGSGRSRTTINGFRGAGGEHLRDRDFVLDADQPPVLVGDDHGATPSEHLLHALGSSLVIGVVTLATVRGIELSCVTVEIEGDLSLLGSFGIDEGTRNGFEQIRVSLHLSGDAEPQELADLVDQARRRSPVHDVVSHGLPVEVRAIVE